MPLGVNEALRFGYRGKTVFGADPSPQRLTHANQSVQFHQPPYALFVERPAQVAPQFPGHGPIAVPRELERNGMHRLAHIHVALGTGHAMPIERRFAQTRKFAHAFD
jgi:hypothetical protein